MKRKGYHKASLAASLQSSFCNCSWFLIYQSILPQTISLSQDCISETLKTGNIRVFFFILTLSKIEIKLKNLSIKCHDLTKHIQRMQLFFKNLTVPIIVKVSFISSYEEMRAIHKLYKYTYYIESRVFLSLLYLYRPRPRLEASSFRTI